MRLIVGMMLGICVSSIATGLAAAAEAAATGAPPAPSAATGELTDGERLFQGSWKLQSHESGNPTGTLRIDKRDFRAETIHGTYTGHLSIRPDRSPAQLDFTIRGCECKYEGMTSAGIYHEDDGGFVFATPPPGEPRPEAFTGLDGTKVMIERATRVVAGGREEPW